MEKELHRLHDICARRNNISSVCLINAYQGSMNVNNAICSAIMSFGTVHGPIGDTVRVLEDGIVYSQALQSMGLKVPGWGCGFEEPEGFYGVMRSRIPNKIIETIDRISDALPVDPNIACYTAAYALAKGIPAELADALVIKFRLTPWLGILEKKFNLFKM